MNINTILVKYFQIINLFISSCWKVVSSYTCLEFFMFSPHSINFES